jgi:dGTPase
MGANGYSTADRERWVPEQAKPSERTPFERDRARVLHSAAFRRLALTTQVISPGSESLVRNRLTHSLEVAQIARELGRVLGSDPDITDAAGLAHDLGHPPFGHNGEGVLDELSSTYGGFEGNAQTLRVLTRLEPKFVAGPGHPAEGRSAGLNLTRACLDAVCKYPWPRGAVAGTGKFGVYAEDLDVHRWVRDGRPDGPRCLEAQVMDFADDVAYSVHDVEDAVVAGRVRLDGLADPAEQLRVFELVRRWYRPEVTPEEVTLAFDRLLGAPFWPAAVDASRAGQAALKYLTSSLIGRFCTAAIDATRQSHATPASRYGADLVVPADVVVEVAVLKGVTAVYVMTEPSRQPEYERQRQVVSELYEALLAGAPEVLQPAFVADFVTAGDDSARRRVVLDQLASLSDVAADAWHARLCSSAVPRVAGSA